jgi:hypothetical protein
MYGISAPNPHPDPYVFGSPGSASGYVSQRYRSEDPYTYHIVTDPRSQHCLKLNPDPDTV